jgi:hypothetical protein
VPRGYEPPLEGEVRHLWPLGHYFSPVPDTSELAREPVRARVWPDAPRAMPELDWREGKQVELLRERLLRQGFSGFPREGAGEPRELREYAIQPGNTFFPLADAWALQAMLRELRPARMIEVGSGFSSLVSARTNREHLGGTMDFTCIEPWPADFFENEIEGISRMLVEKVQEVPLERFEELDEGDVLFIDTSHVAKTGGDVTHLYHEVVPRLRAGVIVHVHDIFMPWDYPEGWVLQGRGWNEQYLVRSFLTFNESFEVLLGMNWMCRTHPELLAAAIDGYDPDHHAGTSLWLRRRR